MDSHFHIPYTVIMSHTGRAEPGLESGAKLTEWNDLKSQFTCKMPVRGMSAVTYMLEIHAKESTVMTFMNMLVP